MIGVYERRNGIGSKDWYIRRGFIQEILVMWNSRGSMLIVAGSSKLSSKVNFTRLNWCDILRRPSIMCNNV
jgi:hypothetical protein